jgi:hypothetical protein
MGQGLTEGVGLSSSRNTLMYAVVTRYLSIGKRGRGRPFHLLNVIDPNEVRVGETIASPRQTASRLPSRATPYQCDIGIRSMLC